MLIGNVGSRLPEKLSAGLLCEPFTPQWPACLDSSKPLIPQLEERDVMLSYPYESMDPFVQLLREASVDPSVVSIKITLYRLASQSHLAEALIAAAENGKEVTALFELRARFDESNNIEWSQRFEEAGCKVIYGFRDYKVHSKICYCHGGLFPHDTEGMDVGRTVFPNVCREHHVISWRQSPPSVFVHDEREVLAVVI